MTVYHIILLLYVMLLYCFYFVETQSYNFLYWKGFSYFISIGWVM